MSSAFNFYQIFFKILRTSLTSRTSLQLGQIGPRTAELAALEHLELSPKNYYGNKVVTTLAHSCLIESSSFLQVIKISTIILIIPPELSAIERLKIDVLCCDHSSAFRTRIAS